MAVERVCVGAIVGAHGVRGLVKVKSFTEDPGDLARFDRFTDESGRRSFRIEPKSMVKDQLLARVEGVEDRDAAEALRGTRLYVDRSALPELEEEEFYHADLIGLRAELPDGSELGRVAAVFDFGAGDVIEIARRGAAPVVVPFTREVVPTVDVSGGRLVVAPPEGLLSSPEEGPETGE